MQEVIIAVIVTLVLAVPITYLITVAYRKKVSDQKIGSAEEKAREIIDEAVKTAETKKRETLLEVKEETIKSKNDLDKEIRERRAEIQRNERRIVQKEENLDKIDDQLIHVAQKFGVEPRKLLSHVLEYKLNW